MIILIFRMLTVATAIGLLAACAPPATTPASSNLTLEMRRLHSALDRQEQSVLDLSHQVAELESRLQNQAEEIAKIKQGTQTTPSRFIPAQAPNSQGVSATSIQGEGSPTEVYLQSFGDYASGRYQTAIHGFETFLQRFPNNSYASNAQFWLGDCYFNQQDYPLAIQEFERVLNDYQNAPKSPDALYKIAISHLQLGATYEARQTVNTLGQLYPKSTAAQKAQELAIP